MIDKMLKICGVVVLLVALLSEKCDATCLCPFDSSNETLVEAYEDLLQAKPTPTPPPSPYSFVRETTYPGLDYSDPDNPELCECEVQKVVRCKAYTPMDNPPPWDPDLDNINSQKFYINAQEIENEIDTDVNASVVLRGIVVRALVYRITQPVFTIYAEIQMHTDPGSADTKVRTALNQDMPPGATLTCYEADVNSDPLVTTTTTSTTPEPTTTTEANNNDDQEEEEEDPNYLLLVTVPSACGILFLIFLCLCCTRNDSRLCNFCSGESDQAPIV